MSVGGVQGGGQADGTRMRPSFTPALIGAGVSAAAMVPLTAAALHRVDVAGRAGASLSHAQRLDAVHATSILAGVTIAGLVVLTNAVVAAGNPAAGTERSTGIHASDMFLGAASALGAGGAAGSATRIGYSTLFAPSGAFQPNDIAGNLEGRFARSGEVPGRLTARVISLLRH